MIFYLYNTSATPMKCLDPYDTSGQLKQVGLAVYGMFMMYVCFMMIGHGVFPIILLAKLKLSCLPSSALETL